MWFLWGFAFAWAECGDSPFIGYSGFLLLDLGWADSSYDVTYKQAYAHVRLVPFYCVRHVITYVFCDGVGFLYPFCSCWFAVCMYDTHTSNTHHKTWKTHSTHTQWIYSWAFSATAITIVGGAIAERTRFRAYVLYSLLLPGLVYPLVEYWIWSVNGWLSSRRVVNCATLEVEPLIAGTNGVMDFAGGLVVHVVGMSPVWAGSKKGLGCVFGGFQECGGSIPVCMHAAALHIRDCILPLCLAHSIP